MNGMEKENIILQKTYDFAMCIVRFCRDLMADREFVLSKQLLRAGTSIGANVEEAQQAQSKNDFISKMNIALKEAYESRYWLRLIKDTAAQPLEGIGNLLQNNEEIIRLLVAIVKSSRANAQ